MIYTLTLPLVDLAIYRFGLLDPAYRSTRAAFVLLWTPLLGAIALAQNRRLERERGRVLKQLQAKNEEMVLAAEIREHGVEVEISPDLPVIEGDRARLGRTRNDLETKPPSVWRTTPAKPPASNRRDPGPVGTEVRSLWLRIHQTLARWSQAAAGWGDGRMGEPPPGDGQAFMRLAPGTGRLGRCLICRTRQ